MYKGIKGFGKETFEGIAGIYKVPRNKIKERGKDCRVISKSVVQGAFGFIVFPITGIMKFLNSTSTGIKNHAKGKQILTRRIRFPRFISEKDII